MDRFTKLISVIVPVYNAENYLLKCVKSILNQSYTNFELILINDGSTDNSFEILKKESFSDARIHLINQENKGVSEARNQGIKLSKGEFICFIDADDWVEENYLLDLVKHFSDSKTLLIQAIYENKEIKSNYENGCFNINSKEIYYKNDILNNGAPFAKLYSTNIIKDNNISFKKGITYGEDLMFFLDYINCIDKIEFINTAAYHYDINSSSASSKKHSFETFYQNHLAIKKFVLNVKNENVFDYIYMIDWNFIEASIHHDIVFNKEGRNEKLKLLNKSIDKAYLKYAGSLNRRILYFLIKFKLNILLVKYAQILQKKP